MLIEDPSVHLLRNKTFPNNGTGISLDREYLITGSNSGYQALNLAILAGARTVLLLGYDGRPAADGRRHWFGNHPVIESLAIFPIIVDSFKRGAGAIKAAGVTVLNCSPGSAIGAFPKVGLAEALA